MLPSSYLSYAYLLGYWMAVNFVLVFVPLLLLTFLFDFSTGTAEVFSGFGWSIHCTGVSN